MENVSALPKIRKVNYARLMVDEVKKIEIIFKGQGQVRPWTYLKKPYALGQVDIEAYEERIRTLTDTKNQSLMILL